MSGQPRRERPPLLTRRQVLQSTACGFGYLAFAAMNGQQAVAANSVKSNAAESTRPPTPPSVNNAETSAKTPHLRDWTDTTGQYKFVAALLESKQGWVRLKQPDGQTKDMRLDQLSQAGVPR